MSIQLQVDLALRKARLVERIEAQRAEIAVHAEVLKKPLTLADKVVQAGHYIKERPWIAGVAALLAVVLGRRNLLRWAGRGWTLWRGWRFASTWLRDHGYLKN